MKKKWEKIKSQIFKVIITINSHHTGAYAAQAAYFFVLSLIPIFSSLDDGSLYADNDERSYDSGFESISGKCCAHDTFDRISSIFSVRNDRSGYDCCSALVSGERRSVCHIGIKQHL